MSLFSATQHNRRRPKKARKVNRIRGIGSRNPASRLHSVEALEDRRLLAADLDWLTQFGGTGGDFVQSSVDSDGNVYVAGEVGGGGVLPGETSAGGNDAFVRKYDSAGNLLWSEQFGTSGSDQTLEVTADSSGVYVLGSVLGTFPGETSFGGQDAFVVKFDHSGNLLWNTQFGTSGTDFAMSAVADGGELYVAGTTTDALPGETNQGSRDVFAAKLDISGNVVWTEQFGTASSDRVWRIAQNGTDLYMVGGTSGEFAGETSAGGLDGFVTKLDTSGTVQWTRQIGTAASDRFFGVTADASGAYVAGQSSGAFPGESNLGDDDAVVLRLDAAGNQQWLDQFGTTGYDEAFRISANATGIYVGGYVFGALPGETSAGSGDLIVVKYDTSGGMLWSEQFGTAGYDFVLGMAIDGANIYLAGGTDGVFPGETNAGSYDALVAKLVEQPADLDWVAQFGGTGSDFVQSAVDSEGNVYVAGEVGGGGALPGQTSAGGGDAFVQKLDSDGSVLWTQQFGTAGYDATFAVAADSSGVYVVGSTTGVFDGEVALGGQDAFVAKFDHAGNPLWTDQFGTSGSDIARSASADATGLYIAGSTSGALPGETNTGSSDTFVVKLDAAGNLIWSDQYGTPGGDLPWGTAVDGSDLYVVGGTSGTFPGETNRGSSDAFITRLDTAGNVLWTRQYGGAGFDRFFDVAAHAGNVYAAGSTNGALPGETNLGSYDAIVFGFDGAGNALWSNQFGTSGYDEAFGIAANDSGVFLGGSVEGVFAGQTSAGSGDVFIRKLDSTGAVAWTEQLGTPGYDYALGFAVDGSSIYLAGGTDDVFQGETSAGFDDAFVAKLSEVPIAPVADIGGPYGPRAEGDSVNLDASFSSDSNQTSASLTYEWDLDNDGQFDDATGATVNLALPDGPATADVAVRVTDDTGFSAVDSATISVTNEDPVITRFDLVPNSTGDGVQLQLDVEDPGTLDLSTVRVEWGDLVEEFFDLGPGNFSLTREHVYSAEGAYTVSVVINDGDGGVVAYDDDRLIIVGTDGDDEIVVSVGSVKVEINSVEVADLPDADVGRLIVLGGDGADNIEVAAGITQPAQISGGRGNDTIRAGGGDSIIDGGDGDDTLIGGAGNDTLIGGAGNDKMSGGAGNDSFDGGTGLNDVVGDADDGNLTATQQQSLELSASFVDPVSATIDWGDDTTPDAGVVDNPAGTVTGTHSYQATGVYTVMITAADSLGAVTTKTVAVTVAPLVQLVEIDVKPSGGTDSVNADSNGNIAVAILGSDEFDASQIDVASVVFAGANSTKSDIKDIDNDGHLDLVLHFRTADTTLDEIYAQLLLDDANGDGVLDSTRQLAEVELAGETLHDTLFKGTDELNLFLAGKDLRELLDELFAP